MKTETIERITVLLPHTPAELTQAVESGKPFRVPAGDEGEQLVKDFGLPEEEDGAIDDILLDSDQPSP